MVALKKFKTLVDLLTYFKNQQICRDYLETIRWNGKLTCPYSTCQHDRVFKYTDGKRYKCAKCQKQFSVKVGTIFEDSKIPLQKWFAAIYLITSHKKANNIPIDIYVAEPKTNKLPKQNKLKLPRKFKKELCKDYKVKWKYLKRALLVKSTVDYFLKRKTKELRIFGPPIAKSTALYIMSIDKTHIAEMATKKEILTRNPISWEFKFNGEKKPDWYKGEIKL